MLLEFGFENYFSFREGGVVSFTFDSNVPDHISQGLEAATAVCIKGANASGKTNVLRAVSFIFNFALNSFDSTPDSDISIESFYENSNSTNFYLTCKVDEVVYRYELEVTEKEVIREALYRTRKKKVLVIERLRDRIKFCNAEFERFKSMKLRSNVSFISLARQHEYNELSDLNKFFGKFISNVAYGGMMPDIITEDKVAAFYSNKPELLKFVSDFVSQCDTGVREIRVFSQKNKAGETEHFPIFYHGADLTLPVTQFTESSGTRALFRRLAAIKVTLMHGGIVVMDEIDIHLHPHILCKLVQLFLDPASNPHNAQLIFTTHVTDVMDTLGRYRTFLVQKNDNESFVYRLDDIPGDILRNDRPISPVYSDGRIGGVPRL